MTARLKMPVAGKGRVLDFDIENRPLSYWISDRPTAEITAIASCWVGEPDTMLVLLLRPPDPFEYAAALFPDGTKTALYQAGQTIADTAWADIGASIGGQIVSGKEALLRFLERYAEADLVTGHYIRKHDLPIINGALLEYDIRPLSGKLTCDTKLDLTTMADIPQSQEHICEVCGVERSKVHMTQHRWREANRLTPEGIVATAERCRGDVLQHMEMRAKLLADGMLGAPRVWEPGGGYDARPDGKRRHR